MSDILVVKTSGLAPWIEGRYGLITGCGEELMDYIEREHEFLPRNEMETDLTYRQIIPYVAVTRGGEIFATRRLNAGGEARLHGKLSLGVGGHIERVDDDTSEGILMRALERELAEEIAVEQVVSLTPLGVINEEHDEVSRVHLGFLFRLEVTGEVSVRETDKLEGMWLTIDELPGLADEMEGWSRITADELTAARGIFTPADILIPREGTDMTRWSCIACDQFTSEPAYWAEAERIVGEAPGTLRLMLPEAYLGKVDEAGAQAKIYEAMDSYVNQGLFRTLENSYIYVERTLPDGSVRRGLVGKLDLECYDWAEGTRTPVRATEGTVESRLPARVAVRAGAGLELPHIMVFINDPEDTLIASAAGGEEVYDFDLMLGGGHIRGERVSGEAASAVQARLDAMPGAIKYAMGDGNHSLAAAKRCWEQIKPTLSEEERGAASGPLRPRGDSKHPRQRRDLQAHSPACDRRGRPPRRLRAGREIAGRQHLLRACCHGTLGELLRHIPAAGRAGRVRRQRGRRAAGGVRRRSRLRPRRRRVHGTSRREERRGHTPARTGQGRALRLHSRTRPLPQEELLHRRGAREALLSRVPQNPVKRSS